MPSPTSSELRIVWSFHFLTPNRTRPRNELSTISRWSTGCACRSCRRGRTRAGVGVRREPGRPWSRAGSTGVGEYGPLVVAVQLSTFSLPLVGERLVGPAALSGRAVRVARCRRRRSARRSPSRSCWASSRPGSPSARCRSRRCRCRRGSRRPARRATSPLALVRPSHQASTIGSDTWSSCSVVHFSVPPTNVFCHHEPSAFWTSPQVVEQPVGRRVVAGRLLRRRHVVEVARPDEVVRAGELLALGLERERAPDPGHVRRRDRRAAVGLVLGRGQHEQRLLVDAPQPRGRRTLSGGSSSVPRYCAPVRLERSSRRREPAGERAGRSGAGGGGVRAEADRERHRLVAALAVERGAGALHDVPGCGRVVVAEVPVLQVLPGIAGGAAVAARRRPERRRRRDRARRDVVVGDELRVRADRRGRRCRRCPAPDRRARRAAAACRSATRSEPARARSRAPDP